MKQLGQGFQKLEPKQTNRHTERRDQKHYYAVFADDKNNNRPNTTQVTHFPFRCG